MEALINRIKDFNKTMNIPVSLKEFGVDELFFLENLDFISKEAIAELVQVQTKEKAALMKLKIFIKKYFMDKKAK